MSLIKPRNYFSITRLVKSFFSDFDADAVIQKMMQSVKWPQSQYYGMTPTQIKKLWSDRGTKAAADGTHMHKCIEDQYVLKKEWSEDIPECQQFKRFQSDHQNWVPYHMELDINITDEHLTDYNAREFMLRGIIDAIFLDENDNLILVDWKRCKDMKLDNRWQSGKPPIEHLDDCNYNHYSLQLNFYKFMIQRMLPTETVSQMVLVSFSPELDSYQKFIVRDLQKEVDSILKHIIGTT